MRALAKDRDVRFQSAREMQQCLEDFARRERIPVSTIALNQFMQGLFRGQAREPEGGAEPGASLMADIIEACVQEQDDGGRPSAQHSQHPGGVANAHRS